MIQQAESAISASNFFWRSVSRDVKERIVFVMVFAGYFSLQFGITEVGHASVGVVLHIGGKLGN